MINSVVLFVLLRPQRSHDLLWISFANPGDFINSVKHFKKILHLNRVKYDCERLFRGKSSRIITLAKVGMIEIDYICIQL